MNGLLAAIMNVVAAPNITFSQKILLSSSAVVGRNLMTALLRPMSVNTQPILTMVTAIATSLKSAGFRIRASAPICTNPIAARPNIDTVIQRTAANVALRLVMLCLSQRGSHRPSSSSL